jgi:putative IMPACT (imprinted ancient) family translation regulator
LIEAYGTAASAALDAAVKGTRTLTASVHIRFAYGQTSEVGQVTQKFGLKPRHSEFGTGCQQTFDVRLRDHTEVVEVFRKMGILAQD